jgi:hypothetical protein
MKRATILFIKNVTIFFAYDRIDILEPSLHDCWIRHVRVLDPGGLYSVGCAGRGFVSIVKGGPDESCEILTDGIDIRLGHMA